MTLIVIHYNSEYTRSSEPALWPNRVTDNANLVVKTYELPSTKLYVIRTKALEVALTL